MLHKTLDKKFRIATLVMSNSFIVTCNIKLSIWSDFLRPLIYLNNPKLYTLSMALRTFADPSGQTDWGAIFAMSSLSLVPVFVIFILFQKYIVEGISTSGLKG